MGAAIWYLYLLPLGSGSYRKVVDPATGKPHYTPTLKMLDGFIHNNKYSLAIFFNIFYATLGCTNPIKEK